MIAVRGGDGEQSPAWWSDGEQVVARRPPHPSPVLCRIPNTQPILREGDRSGPARIGSRRRRREPGGDRHGQREDGRDRRNDTTRVQTGGCSPVQANRPPYTGGILRWMARRITVLLLAGAAVMAIGGASYAPSLGARPAVAHRAAGSTLTTLSAPARRELLRRLARLPVQRLLHPRPRVLPEQPGQPLIPEPRGQACFVDGGGCSIKPCVEFVAPAADVPNRRAPGSAGCLPPAATHPQ